MLLLDFAGALANKTSPAEKVPSTWIDLAEADGMPAKVKGS